jgi:hypothetical protein
MIIIIMMMMIMMMIMIMIMTIVSVEQRPGWGEHAVMISCRLNHIKLRFYQHFVLNRAHPQQTYPFSPVAVTPYS